MIIKSIIRRIYRIYKIKHLFKIQKTLILRPFTISNFDNLQIESYTYIGAGAIFSTDGNIVIKKGSILGPRVKIHTGNHNYTGNLLPYDEDMIIGDVTIEENVWIGSDVIILPGITIGEGSVIGAGSVVSKNIPPLSIAAGNPCRIIKKRNIFDYEILKNNNKIYLEHKFNKNQL